MQQQQINFAHAQPHKTFLGRAQEIVGREMRRPDFGRHEDVGTAGTGGANALSHLALILIDLRGINVAITEAKRLFNEPCTGSPAQLPGTESDSRNARAARFNDFHNMSCGGN